MEHYCWTGDEWQQQSVARSSRHLSLRTSKSIKHVCTTAYPTSTARNRRYQLQSIHWDRVYTGQTDMLPPTKPWKQHNSHQKKGQTMRRERGYKVKEHTEWKNKRWHRIGRHNRQHGQSRPHTPADTVIHWQFTTHAKCNSIIGASMETFKLNCFCCWEPKIICRGQPTHTHTHTHNLVGIWINTVQCNYRIKRPCLWNAEKVRLCLWKKTPSIW